MDEKMNATAVMDEVFREYGITVYHVQLMEYDLLTVWMLDSIHQGESLTKEDLLRFQQVWDKSTFGQLLLPLMRSKLISDEIKGFLERLRTTRNRLVHKYFLDKDVDLQTISGREKTKNSLQEMTEIIMQGQQFIEDILNTYLKDFGVDTDAIAKTVLDQIQWDVEG
jgi:uncharacterized protein YutE (UPF0331/DUF86 family)